MGFFCLSVELELSVSHYVCLPLKESLKEYRKEPLGEPLKEPS